MTPLPQVFVSPPIDPRWVCVVRDGTATAMGYAGDSLESAPDAVRFAAYRLEHVPSPYWRLADPHEVALALWSVLVEQ